MRQSCLQAAIGGVLLLLASPVLARDPFQIPNAVPGSYEDLYKIIKKDLQGDEKTNASAYLEKAQCGGWNMEESVGGKIATVSNVPGHNGDWAGDIPSGMALRDEDLSYAEGADGLSTLCEEGKNTIEKTFWYGIGWYGDFTGLEVIFQTTSDVRHPYFEDPACLWGEEGKKDPPQTPDKCRETHDWLNTYTYRDCKFVLDDVIYFDEESYIDVTVCGEWGDRYTCSDEWADDPDSLMNSRECKDEECRCGNNAQDACVRGRQVDRPYESYYRRYSANYTRDAVSDVPTDVASKDADIACYGKYDEFDPKTHKTEDKDKRCIIDIDLKDMKETQKGKGEYGQNSNLDDPSPEKRNGGKFDEEKDLWYTHLGQAFSLLNDTHFIEKYKRSLRKALADYNKLDTSEQEATVQISEEKPFAEHSFTRAFDETAESRLLVKWWQEQQTRLQTYVHGPVLRLVLPSTWSIGASTDPFLENASVTEAENSLDPRSNRIEVQIYAGEDTLGEAISFIDRSLTLQVVEEPLPVIIPLADPIELRALAASWCAWAQEKSGNKGCDSAEGEVKTLIDDLYDYADAIEEYHALRGELGGYVTELLKKQQEVVKPLTDWLQQNIGDYKESVISRRRIAEEIAPILAEAQGVLASFHDDINMPWCMNQRFTIPIYSLLDPWLPSRNNGGQITNEGLTPFPEPEVPQDFILDLSKISYVQSSISIPVLKPQQVRLDIPRPPHEEEIEELPDIGKEVETILTALKESREQLPEVKKKGTPPTITIPPPVSEEVIGELREAANKIVSVFNGMKDAYDEFWRSVGPIKPKEDEELERQKRELECDWGVFPCIHVEMDLIERLTRIGSRPLVMGPEDYESKGEARIDGSDCPPEDHVCLLLHSEKIEKSKGWEIRGPTEDTAQDSIDDLRSKLRSVSFPEPLGTKNEDDVLPFEGDEESLVPSILLHPPAPLIPKPKQ